jgi:hypothetical protein
LPVATGNGMHHRIPMPTMTMMLIVKRWQTKPDNDGDATGESLLPLFVMRLLSDRVQRRADGWFSSQDNAIAMVKRGMHGQSSTRDLLKDSKTTTSRPPGYTRVAACKSGVARINSSQGWDHTILSFVSKHTHTHTPHPFCKRELFGKSNRVVMQWPTRTQELEFTDVRDHL